MNKIWILILFIFVAQIFAATDPLPSWNDGATKKAIMQFVSDTTKQGGTKYVPQNERIAVFDNDGTLWCEQPIYFQLAFAFDRVKVLSAQHPDWNEKDPFKSVIAGDLKNALAGGEKAIGEIMAVSHAGMTTDEFSKIANDWINTATHPKFKKHYVDLVYQPQIELLSYLRANGFKTFIVSGGGIEFMRPWTEKVYGIPPEQVVGSSGKTKFEIRNGNPVLLKLPQIEFVDDKAGKPVGINRFIGRRPILAFGNSDGDQQMLEYTAGSPNSLILLVHHDDDVREYAYDRKSHIGTLDKAWDEAIQRKWIVVSMKNDWKTIFK
jgi:phosphoglycolate phosphatase-like HAD superfamily hydrolase